ncbi:MAG: hypothetical protein MMC23_002257 [Stictis urceolatum]|nr:hypothetical protein [Stictis urceolata]
MYGTISSEHGDREADDRDAEIVSRHLPDGYSAGPEVLISGNTGSQPPSEQSSLRLQGGDIHRDLYRIRSPFKHKRAVTYGSPSIQPSDDFEVPDNVVSVSDQRVPGGFRRQHMLQKKPNLIREVSRPITDSFVSFLDLYGSFAGEDLGSDDETESAVEDEEAPSAETRPLLARRKSSRRMQRPGDASMTKSFFTLLKAFVGTGIMFLPKAFKNGGILFSSIVLITVAIVSCICFDLLLACRKKYGGGYGEVGEAIGGPAFRRLILCSIFLSQIGFTCACLIFTAENTFAFFEAVLKGPMEVSVSALVGIQLVVLVPLALVRNISKLGPVALAADVCILFGLVYIWWYTISTLSIRGLHPSIELFNPRDFTLTIGSSIFTFEGIGLLLPIQGSMEEPQKFDRLLYIVMFIITIIFTSVGGLVYATFGESTRVEAISNFPQDSPLVNAVQLLYALAVLGSAPVQLFPAVRIVETSLFGNKSSRGSTKTKWKKNFFRISLAVACAAIAIVGASDLDKFVALIGSFACVPLVYIYPALLHWKGVARSRVTQAFDLFLVVLGIGVMAYSTGITIAKWSAT